MAPTRAIELVLELPEIQMNSFKYYRSIRERLNMMNEQWPLKKVYSHQLNSRGACIGFATFLTSWLRSRLTGKTLGDAISMKRIINYIRHMGFMAVAYSPYPYPDSRA